MENLPAQEIVRRSVQALKEGRTAHAVGALTSAGQRIALDLALDTDANCSGTMSLGTEGGFALVKVGKDLWIKPDQTFWDAHGAASVGKVAGDRYLKTTEDDADFGDVTSLCDLTQLADSIGQNAGAVTRGTQTVLGGIPAVTVTGVDEEGEPGTLFVSTQGRPYPLRMEKSSGSDSGGIDFKDFGVPVPSATPGPDQSIDVDQLRQQTLPSGPTASV
ncbi:hypothetical protein GCM10010440_43460 [Kitasatospora cinereorecta]